MFRTNEWSSMGFSYNLLKVPLKPSFRGPSLRRPPTALTVGVFRWVKMLVFRVASDLDRGRIESKNPSGFLDWAPTADTSSTDSFRLRSLCGVWLRFRMWLWMVLIGDGWVTETNPSRSTSEWRAACLLASQQARVRFPQHLNGFASLRYKRVGSTIYRYICVI